MSGIAKKDTRQSVAICTLFIQFPLDRGLFSRFVDSLQENRGYTFYQVGTVLSDILVYWVVVKCGLKYIIHTLLIHRNIGFDLI